MLSRRRTGIIEVYAKHIYLPFLINFFPDLSCQPSHFVHALLPRHARAVGTVYKLVGVVAQTGNLPYKFRMVCAGARMDFFVQDKGSQVFLAG